MTFPMKLEFAPPTSSGVMKSPSVSENVKIEPATMPGSTSGSTTLRTVLLPLALPGVVAGSIFTFSLTLGDFITPLLVGGASSNFIGNVIYANIGTANNLPFAAALALVPIVIMIFYLLGARALGAFESL